MTERADRQLGTDERAALRRTLASQRWTAHNLRLLDDIETIPGTPEFLATDTRLAAIRRALRMRFGDDLTNLRIADLGSLEGGFAVALALDGATVVGVEARAANVEKGELLRRHFSLSNLSFEQADVKGFTVDRFGRFDVVLALGILYHLDRPAAWLRQIAGATASVLIVDSHVAPPADGQLAAMRADIADLSPIELERCADEAYPGRWYTEFDEGISESARADQLWASWSNHRSFWLTEESLLRVLQSAGFDMVVQQHDATLHAYDYYRTEFSRGMYIALRTTPLDSGRTNGKQDLTTSSRPVLPGSTGSTVRLDAIESMLDRHERAIERSKRTVTSLRRQMSIRALPPPQPSEAGAIETTDHQPLLHAIGIERDGLLEVIGLFKRDSVALLGSRRWRVGNLIGRIFTPGIERRRHELASTRLLHLTRRLEAQQLISLDQVPPPAPTIDTIDVTDVTDVSATASARWLLPVQRGYDVLVLANVPWNTRQQRPHHLARTFAAHGHRVFYMSITGGRLGEENEVEELVIEVELEPSRRYDRYDSVPNGDVVEEWMVAIESLRLRHGIDDAVVHVQLQSWTPLAWELRDAHGWRVVYDCMDEWTDFPGMGQALLDIEQELVEGADLVVTTAERLRQKWAPHNANTLLVRNGVDADFFADNCVPSDLLADVAHPIIGFTGAIAPWVDVALVAAVARARPDWTFVLVGDVVVEVDLFGLDQMSNVIMTGLQPYPSMPQYLFWFDVAMIPFVVDQISAAVDPVKFYEYAASGTPIVTSPLPEIDEHRHLMYQGDDPVSFELAIEAALVEDPALRRERIALARSNTWIDRYAEFDRATRKLWPQLSVIIVTYGQLAFTRRCLETLMGNTSYPRLEVIVVDNGSTDGTPMFLRDIAERDQRITAILNPDNRGFAAANNQGLEAATGEVLVLLNNDTEVSPGWHVPLLRHLDDPTIGLIGPRSDHVGNAAQIAVDVRYANDLDGFTRLLQRDHDGELFEMTMLAMFCVAMRREVYLTVGALDEAYGIGLFEDDDYAERVRAAGWRVVCARDAFVHHVGQATFRSLIESGEYHEIWSTNRARFESRWGPWRAQEDGVQTRTVG